MWEGNPWWQNEGKKLAPFPTKTAARRAISMSTAMDIPSIHELFSLVRRYFTSSVASPCVPLPLAAMRKVVAARLRRLLHDARNVRPATREEAPVLPQHVGLRHKAVGQVRERVPAVEHQVYVRHPPTVTLVVPPPEMQRSMRRNGLRGAGCGGRGPCGMNKYVLRSTAAEMMGELWRDGKWGTARKSPERENAWAAPQYEVKRLLPRCRDDLDAALGRVAEQRLPVVKYLDTRRLVDGGLTSSFPVLRFRRMGINSAMSGSHGYLSQ
ncbi:hypothetical protein B0H13DRAFT_1918491 [Mycena leptocephala]|nr:hypothetical protein B0H13DRAFT_1918491 [Mycena leptocephala]